MKTFTAVLVGAAAVAGSATASAQPAEHAERVRSVVEVVAQDPAAVRRAQERQRALERSRAAQESLRARREQQGRYAHSETERITRTLKIGGRGELELSNLAGDIVITRGGGNDVHVEAVKTARGRTPAEAREMLQLVLVEFEERGNRAEVQVDYPRAERRVGQGVTVHRNVNVSVAYNVTAPEHTIITARSLSGSIKVSDIKGELSLLSTSGNIGIYNGARVAAAKSTSGQVEIANTQSENGIEAHSISGNVIVRQVRAPRLELGSVSGRVIIQDVESPRIEAQSMSGDVDLATQLARSGRYDLNSHSGTIRIIVTGNRGFELDANTFSGSVHSDVPLKDQVVGASATGGSRRPAGATRARSLRGSYGDGSATIDVTTFSGSVVVRKK